jgi:hypothetical protein
MESLLVSLVGVQSRFRRRVELVYLCHESFVYDVTILPSKRNKQYARKFLLKKIRYAMTWEKMHLLRCSSVDNSSVGEKEKAASCFEKFYHGRLELVNRFPFLIHATYGIAVSSTRPAVCTTIYQLS